MTAIDTEFDFTGAMGAEAAEEAFKSNSKAFGDRLDYFQLDATPAGIQTNQHVAILRFLSDHVPVEGLVPWITADQHNMVPTKPKPKDADNWPKFMSCLCRNGKIFAKKYGDCYVCTLPPREGRKNSKPSPRTWAIAVLREEVLGAQEHVDAGLITPDLVGQVVGVRDKMKEVAVFDAEGKDTGETKMVKHYVKVNMGWKNFFGPLSGFAGRYKTIVDRDYQITRSGTDANGTVYSAVALDPITLGDGRKFDIRDASIRAEFYPDMPNLMEIIAEQASDDHYNRFFVPDDRLYGGAAATTREAAAAGSPPAGAPSPANTPVAPTTEQAAPQDPARLAELKNRMLGGGAAAAAAPAAASATPTTGAPAGGGLAL